MQRVRLPGHRATADGFCSDRCRTRANRAAKRRKRLGKELTEMERKVETFAIEMRNAIDLLRAELLADDGRDERDQRDV